MGDDQRAGQADPKEEVVYVGVCENTDDGVVKTLWADGECRWSLTVWGAHR